MSRKRLKARDKVTQKMSRDGLIIRNETTGLDKLVSKRDAEFDLHGNMPEETTREAWAGSSAKAERPAYSQVWNRSESKGGKRKKHSARQSSDVRPNEAQTNVSSHTQNQKLSKSKERSDSGQLTGAVDTKTQQVSNKPPNNLSPDIPHNALRQSVDNSKLNMRENTVFQHESETPAFKHQPPKSASMLKHKTAVTEQPKADMPNLRRSSPKQQVGKRKIQTQQKITPRQNEPVQGTEPPLTQQESPKSDLTDTYSQVGNRSESLYRHDKPTVLQHEPIETAQSVNSSVSVQDKKFRMKRNTTLKHSESVPEDDKPKIEKPKSDLLSIQVNDVTTEHHISPIAQNKPPINSEQRVIATPEQHFSVVSLNTPKQPNAVNQKEPESADKATPLQNDVPSVNKPVSDITPDSTLKHDKAGKLQFSADEAAPEKPKSRKLAKAERQAELVGEKLEKAKSKLPSKKKLRSERVFDEQKGKAKRRIYFEKEVKSQAQHLKGALPLRPVKAGVNVAIANAHRKLFQVEHENVSVKAAHRAEMVVEGGVRSALRFHKTTPYRKVTKLEKQAAKKTIKLTYQKTLAENPKLSSNILSRMMQKRKIKKDYAKAVREAKKAAQTAQKASSLTAKAVRVLAGAIRRHPIAAAVIVLLALLLFMLMSLIGLGSGIGNGGLGAILSASYLAEDADIEKSELSYSEWETDLQYQLLNIESSHPGYNEYRYDIGDISHNPYELMAYLTAVYQYFPYDAISADLRALFDEQYSLTSNETTEIRYADPTDANEDGDYEPYEWKILTITLTSRPFGEVIIPKMTADQQQHYAILMQTKGSRQYAGNPFDVGWLPYVTSYYGWRVHPITGAKDLHRGIDIGLPLGTEIRSTQDGTVTNAGYNGNYGNVVVIENEKGLVTKYAHCNNLFVSVGQTVKMGDIIATVGNTGASTGAHLHLEILKNGQYINPIYFVDTGSFNLLANYGIPGAAMGDGSFAALIAEAERHLGKPYIFGSNGPNSFDCSSYVCYVLTQSGVKNMPRTTAQGIYNQCTPIPASEAQPGDLVFFHSTYSTPNTVTHIGIYVGVIDGHPTMIHAGSPVQYTRIDTAYWQNHFYAFGRLS